MQTDSCRDLNDVLDRRFYFSALRSQIRMQVAVAAHKDDSMPHAGIVYFDERADNNAGAMFLCHIPSYQGWVFIEKLNSGFICVEPDIPEDRVHGIAAMCRLIHDRYNSLERLPYAFYYEDAMKFDPQTGEFKPGPGIGLTCATFVLAVLASCGYTLINCGTWPHRSEDKQFQSSTLAHTALPVQTAAPLEGLRKEVGSNRYKPMEVCAAASKTSHPDDKEYIPAEFEFVQRALNCLRLRIQN